MAFLLNVDNQTFIMIAMRTRIILMISLLVLTAAMPFQAQSAPGKTGDSDSHKIFIYSGEGLGGLVSSWVEAYRAKAPEAGIQQSPAPAGEKTEPEPGGIYFFLEPAASGVPWKVEVGRQILVAAFNPSNPWKEIILQKGITQERLLSALTGQETIESHGSCCDITAGILHRWRCSRRCALVCCEFSSFLQPYRYCRPPGIRVCSRSLAGTHRSQRRR